MIEEISILLFGIGILINILTIKTKNTNKELKKLVTLSKMLKKREHIKKILNLEKIDFEITQMDEEDDSIIRNQDIFNEYYKDFFQEELKDEKSTLSIPYYDYSRTKKLVIYYGVD